MKISLIQNFPMKNFPMKISLLQNFPHEKFPHGNLPLLYSLKTLSFVAGINEFASIYFILKLDEFT